MNKWFNLLLPEVVWVRDQVLAAHPVTRPPPFGLLRHQRTAILGGGRPYEPSRVGQVSRELTDKTGAEKPHGVLQLDVFVHTPSLDRPILLERCIPLSNSLA